MRGWFERGVARTTSFALCITLLVACAGPGAPLEASIEPSAETPPNIVVLVADDLGWNDVGYHGSEVLTPNLDRLAEQGVVLDRFYVQPTCSPTRAALMTGKAPVSLGIVSPLSKNNMRGLPLEETLLPQRLQEVGYETSLIGKWHLGGRVQAYTPNARGFDYFFGSLHGGTGFWDHVHGGGYDLQRSGVTFRSDAYMTTLLGDEAVNVIETRDQSRPFFLYVAFSAPHIPNEAPAETVDLYGHIEDPNRRLHAAMVTELDRQVGEIVDTLEAEGLLDNTLIWFLSDNGGLMPAPPAVQSRSDEELADLVERSYGVPATPEFLKFIKMAQRDAASDNSPLPGGKGSIREGGTRVPSLVYWQGQFTASKSDAFVTVQDVMPTLLKVAGRSDELPDIDGRNVLPVLHGKSAGQAPDFVVQARSSVIIRNGGSGQGLNFALYRYPWKLTALADGTYQLFHVEDDPLEMHNVADQFPEIVVAMQEALDKTPRGEPIIDAYADIIADPDLFGGEEDRLPWAEQIEE